MAYSTVAQVRIATGFSDDAKIGDELVEEKIASADSIIDAKISDVYTTPLATPPDIIVEISTQIAKGFLYAREYGEESQDTDKGWKGILEFWMQLLDDIVDQKIKLRGTDGIELTRSNLKLPVGQPTTATSAVGEDDEPRITMQTIF